MTRARDDLGMDPIDIVRRYAEAWRANDITAVFDLYHDDFVLHYFGRSPLAGDHVGKDAAISVLVEATQAIAKVQYGYVEQAVADIKAALGTKQLPKPDAALADLKAAAEKAFAIAKEVVDLTVGAQKRVAELVSERTQAAVTELKALTV